MITIDDFKANTKEWLIDKLGNMSLSDALQTISDLYNELRKPKYPKTYKECCKVLGISHRAQLSYTNLNVERGNIYFTKERHFLDAFMKLRICRNAYWKIAEDWKPNWDNISDKHCIYIVGREIWLKDCQTRQCTLAFPTIEMRDVFYENFKDLIEQCKELL